MWSSVFSDGIETRSKPFRSDVSQNFWLSHQYGLSSRSDENHPDTSRPYQNSSGTHPKLEETTRHPQRCLRAPKQIFNRKRIFCFQYFVQLFRGSYSNRFREWSRYRRDNLRKHNAWILWSYSRWMAEWYQPHAETPFRHSTQQVRTAPRYPGDWFQRPTRLPKQVQRPCSGTQKTFSKSEWDLGKCDAIIHKNEVYPGAKPVKLPNRRMPLHYKHDLQDKLDVFSKKHLIAPCHSPYSAPAMLVPKKIRNLRLAIDYRQLKKQTVKSSWQIPSIEEIFDTLEGSSFFLQCLQVFIMSQWTQPVRISPLSVLLSVPSNGFQCQWVSREAQILSRIWWKPFWLASSGSNVYHF